jgi:hypothetical protein
MTDIGQQMHNIIEPSGQLRLKSASIPSIMLLNVDDHFPAMPEAEKKNKIDLLIASLLEKSGIARDQWAACSYDIADALMLRGMPAGERRPKWKERPAKDRNLKPPDFIRIYYQPLFEEASLTFGYVERRDPALAKAYRSYITNRKNDGTIKPQDFVFPVSSPRKPRGPEYEKRFGQAGKQALEIERQVSRERLADRRKAKRQLAGPCLK